MKKRTIKTLLLFMIFIIVCMPIVIHISSAEELSASPSVEETEEGLTGDITAMSNEYYSVHHNMLGSDYHIYQDGEEDASVMSKSEAELKIAYLSANCNCNRYFRHIKHPGCSLSDGWANVKTRCEHYTMWDELFSLTDWWIAGSSDLNTYTKDELITKLQSWLVDLDDDMTITEVMDFLNDRNFDLMNHGSTGYWLLTNNASFFCLKHNQAIGRYHGFLEIDHEGRIDLSKYINVDYSAGTVNFTSDLPRAIDYSDVDGKDHRGGYKVGDTQTIKSNVEYFCGDFQNIYTINNGFGTYSTNIFAYANAYSQKYMATYRSSAYGSERNQLAIWGVVGDPARGTPNTAVDESSATGRGDDDTETVVEESAIKNQKLWDCGAALDVYEKILTGGTNLSAHLRAVRGNTRNLDKPTVSVISNENSDVFADKSKIGGPEDSTGTTIYKGDDNEYYYKIGPFKMSDYALAFAKEEIPISLYSGSACTIYNQMLGGIEKGTVTFNNGTELEVGDKIKVVYTDMNGNATDIGTDRSSDYTFTPTPEQYQYPLPESTFYLTVKQSDVNGANTLTKMAFNYRQTCADGHGWVITSKYVRTVWKCDADIDPTTGVRNRSGCSTYYCQGCYCPGGHTCPGANCQSSTDSYGNKTYYCPGHGKGEYCSDSLKCCTCTRVHSQGASPVPHGDTVICTAHDHENCEATVWNNQSIDIIQGQPFLAVHDAEVKVGYTTRESTVNVRLTTKVSIDKYIYDTWHNMADELEKDGDKKSEGKTEINTSLYVTEGNTRANQTNATKKAAPVFLEYGDTLVYKIKLKNEQNHKVEVKLRDELPSNCNLLSIVNDTTKTTFTKNNQFTLTSNVITFNKWIEIDSNATTELTITVLVKEMTQSTLNELWENKATIITNNAGYLSDDVYNVDCMRTTGNNRPGPVVNLSSQDTTHYHTTADKVIPTSSDWFRFDDYKADVHKYISKYNGEITAENNNTNNTYNMKITNENNDEGLVINKSKDEKAKGYYTRFDYTEAEKEAYPLAVEKYESLEYHIMVVNEDVANLPANSTPEDIKASATGKAKQVRPSKVNDFLQIGLEMNTSKVTAKIYDKNGDPVTRYGSTDGSVRVSVGRITAKEGYNGYQFTIGNETILNPGDYIIYTVPVTVTKSNMYLYSLSNEAILAELTNINHQGKVLEEYGGEEKKFDRIIKDGSIDDNIGKEASKEYVRLKELVISGRVWLDRNKDGYMDYDQRLESSIDVDTDPSSYIRYKNENEMAMEGIVVRLYRIDPDDGKVENIRTVKTNSEGIYSFGYVENSKTTWRNGTYSIIRDESKNLKATDSDQRIDRAKGKNTITQTYPANSKLYKYYVEFEYDGIVYKSTEVYSGKSNLTDTGDMLTERNIGSKTIKDPYVKDSNADEFKTVRDTFDAKHEIVGYNHAVEGTNNSANNVKLEYEKDGHESYLKIDHSRIMTARSFIDGTDTNYLWLFEGNTDKPETDYLKYINLGLEEREDIDISITQDVYELHNTVNGEEMRYWYNQNSFAKDGSNVDHDASSTEDYSNEFYMTGFLSNSSALKPYEFKYYLSDYNYKYDDYEIQSVKDYKTKNSEIDSEVYFRIKVTNNAIDIDEPHLATDKQDIKVFAGINEVVEYFDEDFVNIEYDAANGNVVKTITVKTKDEDGYLIDTEYKIADAYFVTPSGDKIPAEMVGYNTSNTPITLTGTSMYNENYTDGDGQNAKDFRKTLKDNGYHTVYIRPNAEGINKVILAEGENVDIIIKFTVDKDSSRNLKLGLKTAIAEISAYSTYYQNADGTYYSAGLVDRDSNPGNFGKSYTIGTIEDNGTTRTTYEEASNGTLKFDKETDSKADDPYLAVYEDDTYKSGIILGTQDDNERAIEGQVWDDARSEVAKKTGGETATDGIQYIGDGKNGTVSDIDNNAANENAKINKIFKDLETFGKNEDIEKNDFSVNDVGVKLVEIVRVPVDASGNIIHNSSGVIAEERVYEETISVNDDKSIVETRTGKDGTISGHYKLTGYVPGEYMVRFLYGDTTSEEMTVFNGQDYKSTTYQSGVVTYAENNYLRNGDDIVRDKLNNPKLDTDAVLNTLETKGLSDAKDDELRRLEGISYSETLNNNKTLVLRGYNSTNKELQSEVTKMNADTVDFLVRAEKYNKAKTTLTYSETMDKIKNPGRHPISNIDFGLQYRPEQQVALNKYVKNIKVITSDNGTSDATQECLVDAKFNEYYGIVANTDLETGVTTFAGYVREYAEDKTETVIIDVVEAIEKSTELTDSEKAAVRKDIKNVKPEYIDKILKACGYTNDSMSKMKDQNGNYKLLIAGTKIDEKTSIGISNLQYVTNEDMGELDSNKVFRDAHSDSSRQGFVYLNIDDEIMQGAQIKIDYLFVGNNISEIDRVNKNLSILRFKDNLTEDSVWIAGNTDKNIKASLTFGGNTYGSLKEYYDKVGNFNYDSLVVDAQRITGGLVGGIPDSLITRLREGEDILYSGALTARNAMFNEYYRHEISSTSPAVAAKYIHKGKSGDIEEDIIYRVKHKTIGDTTNDYYGRYLGSTYYTGKVGNNDVVSELKINEILDYIDNNLVFESSDNTIETKNRYWKQVTAAELVLGGFVGPNTLSFTKDDIIAIKDAISGVLQPDVDIDELLKKNEFKKDWFKFNFNDYLQENVIAEAVKAIQRYSNSNRLQVFTERPGNELIKSYANLLTKGLLLDSNGVEYNTDARTNLAVLQDIRTSDKETIADIANADITKYLSPRDSEALGSYGAVEIMASKVIAAEDDTKDMIYENVGEIIEYSSVTGRVTNLSTTLGNVDLSIDPSIIGSPSGNSAEYQNSKTESDTASVERVTLTPPTGLDRMQQVVRNVIEKASYSVVIIIAVIIVCVAVLVGIKAYRKRRIK